MAADVHRHKVLIESPHI